MADTKSNLAETIIILAATHGPVTALAVAQRMGSGVMGGEQATAWWLDPLSSVGAMTQQGGLVLLLLYIFRLRGVSIRTGDCKTWVAISVVPLLFACDVLLVGVVNGSLSTVPDALTGAYLCATSFSVSHFATAVAALGIAAGAALEESLRAYCITRIGITGGRPIVALVTSVTLSLADHLYYGSHELADVGLSALVYGLVFLRVRTVVPFFVSHFLYNLFLLWLWTCSP